MRGAPSPASRSSPALPARSAGPLSSLGLETIGWQETCFAWTAAHIVIGLPLNLMLPRAERAAATQGSTVKPYIRIDRTMVLLSFAFAAAWTVTSTMAAHLPRIVETFGATPAQAVFAGMMIGPAQVAARVLEASVLGRFHPLVSTRLACLTHPIGAIVIGAFGGGAARFSRCCTVRATAFSPLRAGRCLARPNADVLRGPLARRYPGHSGHPEAPPINEYTPQLFSRTHNASVTASLHCRCRSCHVIVAIFRSRNHHRSDHGLARLWPTLNENNFIDFF